MKFFLVILMFASHSFALDGGGFDVGNGGLAVKCSGDSPWRSLDLVEGVYQGTKPWAQISSRMRTGRVLEAVLDRAQRKCPSRFSQYHEYVKDYYKGVIVSEGGAWELNPTKDANTSLPRHCVFEQAAIQWRLPGADGVRFYLNKEVWDEMRDLDQAALVIHEIMYRLYILENGEDLPATSDHIRPQVALLFSEGFGAQGHPGFCDQFPRQQPIN